MPLHILIVEDHILFREGLMLMLRKLADEVSILEAQDCAGARAVVKRHAGLDLVLLDLALPDTDDFSCLDSLLALDNALPIVILSANEEKAVVDAAIRKGARGYIPKVYEKGVILSAIQLVLSGGVYVPPITLQTLQAKQTNEPVRLTDRQKQVLQLIDDGLSNKQIAQKLLMTEGTVKAHITAIFRVLKVENRVSACNVARQMNILDG